MASDLPIPQDQLSFLQDEIVREARRTLVGRRFLDIYGPLTPGLESVGLEEYGPDHEAEIELEGRVDPNPIMPERENFIRVPVIFKDFVLHWRDVELARKLGSPLDPSRAIRAAHFVAHREDHLIFHGEPRFQLEGLLNCTGRNTIARGDWTQFGAAYQNIVEATEVLLGQNHHRPFALVVSAIDYARLVQLREGQFAPEIDAMSRLCDDGIYNSSDIPEGKAVLLSTGNQNVDLAVTEDLKLHYLGERDQDFPFRVYECLVLRIKRPKAICTIE